jgi:ribonuclease P protein component
MVREEPAGPGGLLCVTPHRMVQPGQLVSLQERALLLHLMTPTPKTIFRLRKHADYQRVYKASRKQFAKQMTYFFTLRPLVGPDGTPVRDADASSPRVGLTVGKVMGKAVDRNRIKRRMREAVRKNLATLSTPVDVILHPRRSVIDLDFALLEREVGAVFHAIQKAAERQPGVHPSSRKSAASH